MKPTEIIHDSLRLIKKVTGSRLKRTKCYPNGRRIEGLKLSESGQEDLPVGLTGGDQDIWRHTWPAVSLYNLENVYCTGDQGLIFLDQEHLFAVCSSLNRLPDRKVRLPVTSRAVLIEDPVFHLSGFSPENHGHYFFHHLPRVLAARKLLQDRPSIKILCARGHMRWQSRYLAKFGISPDRLIETSIRTLKFKELYYVPITSGTFKLGVPAHYRAMQRAFTGEAVLEKKGYPLWISRMDAPDKKLRNEKDLIGCVADLFGGVRVIELSKYSMEQQTRLFAEARFIFGPLGQGVANILYSRESVLIILAAGSEGKPVGASLMTGAAGAIVGNRALCLNSGTTYQGKRREWIYPIEKFQSELRTLVEQVKKISGDIESF